MFLFLCALGRPTAGYEGEGALLAGAFAEGGGLEHLDAPVVELADLILGLGPPVLLVLEAGLVVVQVPGRAGHILRDVRVDLAPLLVHRRGGDARLAGLLQLLVPPELLMALEQRVGGRHGASPPLHPPGAGPGRARRRRGGTGRQGGPEGRRNGGRERGVVRGTGAPGLLPFVAPSSASSDFSRFPASPESSASRTGTGRLGGGMGGDSATLPLFASVGHLISQAGWIGCNLSIYLARLRRQFIDTLTWSLLMSLLTHRLVLLCVDAYCFVFWDLPGDVLAAPESALCGWIGVIPLSLSLLPGLRRD